MDQEKKLIFITVIIVCFTMVFAILFIALWQYKEMVGITLLGLLVLCVVVFLRGRINEQDLRHVRYKHKEEMPLNMSSSPLQGSGMPPNPYCIPMTQPNPYASSSAAPMIGGKE